MTVSALKNKGGDRKQDAMVHAPFPTEDSAVSTHEPLNPLLDLQREVGNRAFGRLLNGSVLQRKCACGNAPGPAGECEECRNNRLQREIRNSEVGTQHDSSVPPIVHEVLRSPGQPLDPATRAFLQPRFGQDFSQVRVHTDAMAAESAREVNASAYTVGRDIVFDAAQYMPNTSKGLSLLSHELAHTIQQALPAQPTTLRVSAPDSAAEQEAEHAAQAVQQGNFIVQARSDIPQVARQKPPSGQPGSPGQAAPATSTAPSPTATSAAPAGPQPWANCPPKEIGNLNRELAEAISWVQQGIDDLQAKELSATTRGSLGRYLTTDPMAITKTILPTLKAILNDLKAGAVNFQCQTQATCNAVDRNAFAYATYPISLCPKYFDEGSLERVSILIHESGHHAGLRGDIYEWKWPFPGLTEKERLANEDSYVAFVRSNRMPGLPPLVGPTGLGVQLGSGALFPGGGAAPRFVISAEFDPILKHRVFRFINLQLGERVDVDSSGSVIASLSFGARAFAPVSVSKTPLFLDLRTGAVAGAIQKVGPQFKDPTGTGFNVLGVSGEVRAGFESGHFGGSIDYRHIFNLLKNSPDLDEVIVSGEIRF